jgi:hypothetical protein
VIMMPPEEQERDQKSGVSGQDSDCSGRRVACVPISGKEFLTADDTDNTDGKG